MPKARKDHFCSYCQTPILKGSNYILEKYRLPRYDNDKQVGIEFIANRKCGVDCKAFSSVLSEPCEIHSPVPETYNDGWVGSGYVYVPTGKTICSNCGTYL